MTKNKSLIEFNGLVTEFHTDGSTVRAVDNISFTLNKGETIGVVGESGSGKSVTSLSAMRLVPSPPGKISSGEIIFHKNESTSATSVNVSNAILFANFSFFKLSFEWKFK